MGSRSSAKSANGERDADELDARAAELYALHPDAFAAARDSQVRTARTEGQQSLARELSKLRRPTLSAWLINLLWRDQREVLEQLFELADEMRRAQTAGSGPELRTLTAQRRELEAALLQRARTLAEQAGVKVTDATAREAQDTLAAALARPDVADEVRTGRLVKPASYAGFGPLPATVPPAGTVGAQHREPTDATDRVPVPIRRPKTDDREAQAAQRARERREEAERRVQEARSAVDTAAAELADQGHAAEMADRHLQDLREQVDRLRAQLRELEHEVTAAEQAARAAATRRQQADKAHQTARQTLERTEQQSSSSSK
jgi:hypothetical protein